MKKFTLKQKTFVQIAPPRQIPATTFPVTAIDFTRGVQWIDDPIAQTLTARLVGWPKEMLIMGDPAKTGAATPYDPAWTDEVAMAAFLKQVGLTVDAAVEVT